MPLWIVLPVVLLLFCALHWVSMRHRYETGLRNLRASSGYRERAKQLREDRLAEVDRKKGGLKRTKKCAPLTATHPTTVLSVFVLASCRARGGQFLAHGWQSRSVGKRVLNLERSCWHRFRVSSPAESS